MKRYKEFMNGVKASDTLHQRLMELETPAKRPIPWKRYGAMAAALVLVCSLGGFAAWAAQINSRTMPIPFYPAGYQMTNPEIADVPVPDIAPVDPGDVTEPEEKTLGGYEVRSGSGPEAMVSYYILPYIEYGDGIGQAEAIIDWVLPQEVVKRDLTQEEIVALLGGEDVVITHLDWGSYELTGWGAWYEDGSFWGACIDGLLMYVGGPSNRFQFAVTAKELPPPWYGYPETVTQKVRGLTVNADKGDWEEHIFERATPLHERRISFMKGGYGYRFQITCGGDGEAAELLASRLLRQIADKGLALYTVDPAFKTYTCTVCGEIVPVSAGVHVHSYVDLGGNAVTHPYDPSGEPDAPPVSVSDAPDDDPYMCSGYPVPPTPGPEETGIPEFDPDYDPTYEDGAPDAGPAESWEICDGLPLALEGWNGP